MNSERQNQGYNAQIRDISARTRNLITRGIARSVNDALLLQVADVDLLNGQKLRSVERLQEYGFSSVPQAEASEVVVVNVGSNPDHPIIIKCDDRRFRMRSLGGGEVALYDDNGQSVHLARDRITLTSPTRVVVDAPLIDLGGEGGAPVAVQGSVDSAGHALVSNFSTRVRAT